MRWIWIFLWIALSAIQLLVFGFKRLAEEPAISRHLAVEEDLIELARQTNRTWILMNQPEEEVGKDGRPTVFSADSVKREEWILRLSELQQRLIRNGVETRFMDDLERWLSMRSRIESSLLGENTTDAYLSSVFEWFDPFLSGEHAGSLVRIRLEPAADSMYPDLHFELSGNPRDMGTMLLQSSNEKSDWQVRELDLYCREDLLTWWIQGTCSFLPTGNG